MHGNDDGRGSVDRRSFLKIAGIGALAMSSTPLFAACTNGASSTPNQPAASGHPKRGGTLRAGLTGGGQTDTVYPAAALTAPSYAAGALLFDALSGINRQGKVELRLADEITPNADASEWTIRLKRGITFHNGKSATADDLIYTF